MANDRFNLGSQLKSLAQLPAAVGKAWLAKQNSNYTQYADNKAQKVLANRANPNYGKAQPSSYKKGGKVKKTGMAKVHKGERVLTKAQTKKLEKSKKTKGVLLK